MQTQVKPLKSEVFYPSEDGEPLAETQEHVMVILVTMSILTQYLRGQEAAVFANQFLYYIEGKPTARVAPDGMVVFNIPARLRGNYKIWEEGEVPSIVFEMTSAGTRENDFSFKKILYEQLGVKEYWLFDPYGEWISEQLRGYRLNEEENYRLIPDNRSEVLNLLLRPDGYLIGFYRLDNNEKLLTPDELFTAVEQAEQNLIAEKQRTEQERQRADRLAEKLRNLGIDP